MEIAFNVLLGYCLNLVFASLPQLFAGNDSQIPQCVPFLTRCGPLKERIRKPGPAKGQLSLTAACWAFLHIALALHRPCICYKMQRPLFILNVKLTSHSEALLSCGKTFLLELKLVKCKTVGLSVFQRLRYGLGAPSSSSPEPQDLLQGSPTQGLSPPPSWPAVRCPSRFSTHPGDPFPTRKPTQTSTNSTVERNLLFR